MAQTLKCKVCYDLKKQLEKIIDSTTICNMYSKSHQKKPRSDYSISDETNTNNKPKTDTKVGEN